MGSERAGFHRMERVAGGARHVVPKACLYRVRCGKALVFVLLASLLFCASGLLPVIALAEENDKPANDKAIAIAYDNSGSMFEDTRWNAAQYSVEVLAAMLDEGDALAVFAMDQPGAKITVSGDQEATERVDAIHNADLGFSEYTNPQPTQDAFDYLKSADASEKWLVITTDGEFNQGGGIAQVQDVANQAAAEGMNVIYLAIGNDTSVITEDANGGISVKRASSDNVLSSMTEVINQIFGRATLPSGCLDTGNGSLTLEVPMSQIVVFAQGEDVSIGKLTQDGGQGASVIPRTVSVSHVQNAPEGASASGRNHPVDDQLRGVVATFDSNLPAGVYHVDVAGAQNTAVYYVPYVSIAVGLTGEDGVDLTLDPTEANTLYAGTYQPNFSMIDPFTNEPLSSSLLDPATYTLRVSEGGTISQVAEGESFSLTSGSANFDATVETVGGARATQSFWGVEVGAAPVPIIVDAGSIPESIPIADFDHVTYPVTVRHADGSSLTTEEWRVLEADVSDDSGIQWSVAKDDENQTIVVGPTCGGADKWSIEQELFGFSGLGLGHGASVRTTAQSLVGDSLYSGEATRDISYTPDWIDAILHDLWWIVLATIAIILAIGWIRKPRLPRGMKPNVKVEEGLKDVTVPLRYDDGNIRNKFAPFVAETADLGIHAKGTLDSEYPFRDLMGLSRVRLTAIKKRDGKRRFVIEDLSGANKPRKAPGETGMFDEDDNLPRFAKSGYTEGSSISISGKNLKGKPATYTLRFKKSD